MALPDGLEEVISLMSRQSASDLQSRRNHRYIHLGLIVLGVRGLSRKGLGGKVLLVLVDTRIKESTKDAIIGMIEVDMNNNFGLAYIAPNYFMTLKDFCDHIKIIAQAKGYKNLIGKNILLDIVFLGKTMNHINVRYKVNIEQVIASVQSKGVRIINPMVKSSDTLAGLEWTIRSLANDPTSQELVPTESIIYEDKSRNVTSRFTGYIPSSSRDPLDQVEEEDERSQ